MTTGLSGSPETASYSSTSPAPVWNALVFVDRDRERECNEAAAWATALGPYLAASSAFAAAAIVAAALDIWMRFDSSEIWLTLRRRRLGMIVLVLAEVDPISGGELDRVGESGGVKSSSESIYRCVNRDWE